MIYKRRFVIAAASSALALAAQAQDTENEPLEQVVVTGTRVANRSALDTAVPVDVVSSEQLQNVGVAEINQALAVALPSFNFPRPGLADGTDTIRPATLRGLAPDQTLVLVNGKRRHAASLVNVNGTIGRGSSAVDLNTIPTGMVQSIEVLRDGASAQYGSDAIAGVLNLRLREAHEGGDATVSYGWRDSSYDTPTAAPDDRFPAAVLQRPTPTWSAPPNLSRDVSDGETLVASIWKGLALGESGFVTRRRRVQGPGAHRARRLRYAAPVSAAAGQRVRSARSDVQPLQLLVRRAGARSEDRVRQRRLRFRERRAHVRLGELAGPRREGAGLLSPRRRSVEPQRDRDLSRTASCRSSRRKSPTTRPRTACAGSSATGTWTPRWCTARTRWSSRSRTP